jgi:transposase-like protein
MEDKTVSEICDEHQLNVHQFYTWQQLFFENKLQ